MRLVGQDDAGWVAVDLDQVARTIALLRLPGEVVRRLVEPARQPVELTPDRKGR